MVAEHDSDRAACLYHVPHQLGIIGVTVPLRHRSNIWNTGQLRVGTCRDHAGQNHRAIGTVRVALCLVTAHRHEPALGVELELITPLVP